MFRLYALLLLSVALASPAHAYLDPGVGSFVLQMTIAGALAFGATMKLYWYRIKSFVQRGTPGERGNEEIK